MHLVRGDAAGVEPARELALLVQGHRDSFQRQVARRGQRGRAGADAGDLLSVRRRLAQEARAASVRERGLDRVALEPADLDRRVPMPVVVDTGAHAQHLHRAHARARVAEQIGGEDRPGRAAHVVGRDLADEGRDVDTGRAGLDAGRVVAVETARSLADRLAPGIGGLAVGQLRFEAVGGEPARSGSIHGGQAATPRSRRSSRRASRAPRRPRRRSP